MQIYSTYKQYGQTAHPDVLVEIPFRYLAIVHDDEEVTILSVWQVDGNIANLLRIDPKSGNETSMLHFLANIREHARNEAYKRTKQNQDAPDPN